MHERRDNDGLAERFEAHRSHLRGVAYRMLGSTGEADDAVQETWLRLDRSDASTVENLAGWLTTAVARVCLDVLRSRRSRAEQSARGHWPEPSEQVSDAPDPEQEAVLAESVGQALMVVLEMLAPAERITLVLHDAFAVPFAEIAPILGRSPAATKKLAGRARGKVHARPHGPEADLARHRRVVDAFLAAVRSGDMDALLAVLAPDVVRRVDPAALPPGAPVEVQGAHFVVEEARTFARRVLAGEPALVNGTVGIVVGSRGRLGLALTFTIEDDRIAAFEVIADPARLGRLDLAVFDPVSLVPNEQPATLSRNPAGNRSRPRHRHLGWTPAPAEPRPRRLPGQTKFD